MYKVIDYKVYVMTREEKVKYTALASTVIFLVGTIFFNNIWIALLMSAGGYFYLPFKTKELIKKRKTELKFQFRNALYSLSSALGVGMSLENAFRAVLKDLRVLYPENDTYIIKEFELINRMIELNEPIENILQEFAQRSGLDDIKNFADIISICRRTGGNLVAVIKNTSHIISDKIEISEDIDIALAKQKYEQKLLNFAPLVVIALIRLGGAGYMDTLYTSITGYLLIALVLGILIISHIVSKKILDIRV